MLQDEWQMTGDATSITLCKNEVAIIFDIIVPTSNGRVYCLQFKRQLNGTNLLGLAYIDSGYFPGDGGLTVVFRAGRPHRVYGRQGDSSK